MGAGLATIAKSFGGQMAIFTGLHVATGGNAKDYFPQVVLPSAMFTLAPKLFGAWIMADLVVAGVEGVHSAGKAVQQGFGSARIQTLSGGPIRSVDTRQAATMRQRALSDISASGMSLRNALTNSGRIYHYRYTRR